MFLACKYKRKNIVQFLHTHGAAKDINTPSLNQYTPLWKLCKENSLDIVRWLILQGPPLKTTVASWFNQLHYQNRMILFQQGIANRDTDHENFVAFICGVRTATRANGVRLLDIDLVLFKIGEYLRGISDTRSLWYHIVRQGPGDNVTRGGFISLTIHPEQMVVPILLPLNPTYMPHINFGPF
jgi:hypothetical protein